MVIHVKTRIRTTNGIKPRYYDDYDYDYDYDYDNYAATSISAEV